MQCTAIANDPVMIARTPIDDAAQPAQKGGRTLNISEQEREHLRAQSLKRKPGICGTNPCRTSRSRVYLPTGIPSRLPNGLSRQGLHAPVEHLGPASNGMRRQRPRTDAATPNCSPVAQNDTPERRRQEPASSRQNGACRSTRAFRRFEDVFVAAQRFASQPAVTMIFASSRPRATPNPYEPARSGSFERTRGARGGRVV